MQILRSANSMNRPTWLRYGVALASFAFAAAGQFLIGPLATQIPFLLFLAAIPFAAWYGGLGPGLLVTALSAATSGYFFLPPYNSLDIGTPDTQARLGIFLLVALLINVLSYARSLAEATTRDQAERLRVTLASIGDAVIAVDTGKRVSFMNPVAEELTGWTQADAMGRPIHDIFRIVNEETRTPVDNPVDKVFREKKVTGLANHTLLIARDGTEHPIDDSGAPIRDGKGHIVGAILVFRDITVRRQAEKEIADLLRGEQQARKEAEAARDEAHEATRLRDQFLSIASHELRTPLTAMKGYAQIVQRRLKNNGQISDRDRESLDMVVKQTDRLARMITSMLDLSRIETGQLSLQTQPLDICALTERVAQEQRDSLQEHEIDVVCPDYPLVINGDELRLEQVLVNLLQNAVKYDSGHGIVRVVVEQIDKNVCVSVIDHGIGIPEEAQSRLFQRFYRAPNVDPRNVSGMGIGLYVVKEIAALHGGAVTVKSKEGEGSTFTVCLPLLVGALPEEGSRAPAAEI